MDEHMAESTGRPCPECGAPRGAGNTPSCSCAQRAAETLRDTRTAEAAAAEDFDPLRIRPYVELEGPAEGTGAPAPDATMPLRAVAPVPDAGNLSLFDAGPGAEGGSGEPTAAPPPDGTDARQQHGRSRRAVLLAGAAVAVVAVVVGAAFAGGLFSYDPPTRDTADSGDVRASVPVASATATGAASPSPDAGTSARATESTDASPSSTKSSSPSASASSSASSSASAPASASPTPTATAGGTASAQPQYGSGTAPVLQRGDRGPEVSELQLRLKQLWLYAGDTDGVFTSELDDSVRSYQWTRGLSGDPKGVYGAETRAALERETSEP